MVPCVFVLTTVGGPEPQGVQREVRAVPKIFPEEVYSDIHTSGRPHVEYVAMFSNWTAGESSGPAAAGHNKSPHGAQAQDADSGPQTDSGLQTPEEENSVMPKYGRPYDRYVIEGLCSLMCQQEKAMVRLQRDMTDHRTELRLRTQTPDRLRTPYSGPQRKKIR